MNRRNIILCGLAGLLAMSTPQVVDRGVELVASASAEDFKRSIDDKAIGIIDGFDEDKAYSDIQNGNYDKVLNDYMDGVNFLMQYDLSRLDEEKRVQTAEMFNNVGYSLLKKGRCLEAIPIYQRTLIFSPNSAFDYAQLGFCYVRTKQFDKALGAYQTAHDLFEDQTEKENALIYIKKIEKILNR